MDWTQVIKLGAGVSAFVHWAISGGAKLSILKTLGRNVLCCSGGPAITGSLLKVLPFIHLYFYSIRANATQLQTHTLGTAVKTVRYLWKLPGPMECASGSFRTSLQWQDGRWEDSAVLRLPHPATEARAQHSRVKPAWAASPCSSPSHVLSGGFREDTELRSAEHKGYEVGPCSRKQTLKWNPSYGKASCASCPPPS